MVPVSGVWCAKKGDDVPCHVEQAFLGIVSFKPLQIDHVLGTDISVNKATVEPGKESADRPRPNETYQLAFLTPQGRIAPIGLDAADTSTFTEIANGVEELKTAEGEPFTTATWNTFPIVAGLIFV